MSTGALDPLIHNQPRLRIVATLAALPEGDTLSVTRLRAMPPARQAGETAAQARQGPARTRVSAGPVAAIFLPRLGPLRSR
jgi:hypothetical protein